MNYFRLYHSLITSEIGFYPQVFNAIVSFDIYNKNSAYYLNFSKANENTLWPISKLAVKAKKTDLVSVSFMGLSNKILFSEKLYLIVSKFHQDGLQFVQTKLLTKGSKEYPYWIVNPYKDSIANLDPLKSSFSYLKGIGVNEIAETNIHFENSTKMAEAFDTNKMDAILKGLENHKPLIIDKLSLKKDLMADFFAISSIQNSGIGYFVSERLKNEIEAAFCTGIVFTEPNGKYP